MFKHEDAIASIQRGEEDGHKPSVLSDLLCCPFCGEEGFDKMGLKGHLEHMDCEIYNETEVPRRLFKAT